MAQNSCRRIEKFAVILGLILIPCILGCRPGYYTSPDGAVSGALLQDPDVNTTDACKFVCEPRLHDNDCLGFQFDDITATCWVIPKALVDEPVRMRQGMTVYVLVWECDTCRYRPFPGKTTGHSQRTLYSQSANLETCLRSCNLGDVITASDECASVERDHSGRCWHLPAMGAPTMYKSNLTYFRRLDCGEIPGHGPEKTSWYPPTLVNPWAKAEKTGDEIANDRLATVTMETDDPGCSRCLLYYIGAGVFAAFLLAALLLVIVYWPRKITCCRHNQTYDVTPRADFRCYTCPQTDQSEKSLKQLPEYVTHLKEKSMFFTVYESAEDKGCVL